MKLDPFIKWTAMLVMAALIASMLLILRNHESEKELNEKILNHSEIIDTV